jgi:hypothetical protein
MFREWAFKAFLTEFEAESDELLLPHQSPNLFASDEDSRMA